MVANRARSVSFIAARASTIVCYDSIRNRPNHVSREGRSTSARSAPTNSSALATAGGMTPPPRQLNLLHTLTGRLALLSGALWLVLVLVQRLVALPPLLEIFRKVNSLALIGSTAWLVGLIIARNRRRLLWRVRRKLILSYVFLGVFPVVLVGVFALFVAVLFYTDVSAYMFHEGFNDLSDNVQQFAETSAIEISRSPAATETGIERKVSNLKSQFAELSMAVVPVKGSPAGVVSAGPWQHAEVPKTAPA